MLQCDRSSHMETMLSSYRIILFNDELTFTHRCTDEGEKSSWSDPDRGHFHSLIVTMKIYPLKPDKTQFVVWGFIIWTLWWIIKEQNSHSLEIVHVIKADLLLNWFGSSVKSLAASAGRRDHRRVEEHVSWSSSCRSVQSHVLHAGDVSDMKVTDRSVAARLVAR